VGGPRPAVPSYQAKDKVRGSSGLPSPGNRNDIADKHVGKGGVRTVVMARTLVPASSTSGSRP
jgi:hypothetical protein